jgi:multiple sugar transport system permease protein
MKMKNHAPQLDRSTSRLILKYKLTKFVTDFFRYAFLICIGYIIIMQLLFVVSYAFRPESQIDDPSVVWIPKSFTLENFEIALEAMDYFRALGTTLGVQILSGLIEVFTCSLVAYGMARFKFKGAGVIFFFVIVTILIPPQMTAVPMSLNFAHFDVFGILGLIGKIIGTEIRPNLLDTGFTFWLPSLFGVGLRSGLFIFIYRQFFKGLPKELEEAAYIDGANALTAYVRVILPSSGVAMLTVSIFSMVWHWNDYYMSVLYFSSDYPLSVMLDQINSNIFNTTGILAGGADGAAMAAVFLFILPPLVMYMILQRKFIASIDRVGIVG